MVNMTHTGSVSFDGAGSRLIFIFQPIIGGASYSKGTVDQRADQSKRSSCAGRERQSARHYAPERGSQLCIRPRLVCLAVKHPYAFALDV